MANAIAHRGPDGDGFYFAPGIGFGHRRLAIIDLVSGDQPMFNADRTVCIIFNGEIYNFRDLRRELEARGRRFVTNSDTEVIIQAWDEWREGCLDRLRGMFALALWDARDKTLLLARDRLGEKPLYYSVLPDQTLIFGSEIKALLVGGDIETDLDPCAIEEFFALGYIAEPRSIYRNILQLPAGSCLIAKRHRSPELRQYWEPQPRPESGTEEQLADSLISRLGRAVKSQLVADVPIGAFLSGGVDSSGTMATMALSVADPIRCFTIGFDDAEFDEASYASLVAQRYGARHDVEIASATDFDVVNRLPTIFDQPFGDSSAFPAYLLARLARRHVTVALSGDAGDELFAGYRRYAFHAREQRVRQLLPSWLRSSTFGVMAGLYPQLDWAPRTFRAKHTFEELGSDEAGGYFLNVSVLTDRDRKHLFAPSLRTALKRYNAREVIDRHMRNAPRDDVTTTAQYIDLKTWLPGDILTKVDRTAMASSLEVRVPMLDHDFVDWALGLPTSLKSSNGQGKYLLKRAFERLAPKEVLYRPKQGFSVPLARWFRGPLGKQFEHDLAACRRAWVAEFLDLPAVERLLWQHRSGLRDHSRALWLTWMFQKFLEHDGARHLAAIDFTSRRRPADAASEVA
jgi:asparagine synthase (glutamine-hydrolysing)